MKLNAKFVISIIVIAALLFGGTALFDFIKEKYIYPLIINKLQNYVESNWNGRLIIGRLKGNIFTNLYFENLLLDDVKGVPKELELKIDSVKVAYKPFGIFWGEFDAEFKDPQIIYKNMSLPLDMRHHKRITTVGFNKRFSKLDDFVDVLPRDIYLAGSADAEGEVILKNFKSQFFNVHIISHDCQAGFAASLKMRGDIDLVVDGKIDNPRISGNINISRLYLTNGLSGLSLFKKQKTGLESRMPKKSVINVHIDGNDVIANDRYLNIVLNSFIKLEKEAEEGPYVAGRIDILRGKYKDYSNTFDIKKGQILFADKNKSPSIELEAETKIRRYRIYASIKGTLENSYLTLSSRPELTHAEIASLLVFGKKINDLTTIEKKGLTSKNFNNILINNIFLGKAEARLTELLGVDDINFEFDTEPDAKNGLKSPSIEVGKYIAGDKLYGTYSIKPQPTPEQAVKGELELRDNIILKGERHWLESLQTPLEDKMSIEFRWKF